MLRTLAGAVAVALVAWPLGVPVHTADAPRISAGNGTLIIG